MPTIFPLASSPARMSATFGCPCGDQPWTSQRMYCTRTGLPTSCDMSAASAGSTSSGRC